MRPILKGLQLLMAANSELFYSSNIFKKIAKSIYYAPQYCFSVDKRNERFTDLRTNANVHFVKVGIVVDFVKRIATQSNSFVGFIQTGRNKIQQFLSKVNIHPAQN